MSQRTLRIPRLLFAAAIALAASQPVAQAQDAAKGFPSRPIRLVIGFAAGGGNDILARIVTQKVSEGLGQPIIIENKAGAQSIIATEYVKNATPDGYTMMMGAIGAMAINPAVFAKLPYDTVRDFKPLTMLGSFPLILTVAANSQFKTVQDVVNFVSKNS